MTNRKIYVFAVALAAAGLGLVLFNRSAETAAEESAARGNASEAVSAGVAEPVATPALQLPASTTNQTPTARGTLPYVLTSVKPFDKPLRLAAEALGARTVSVVSRKALLIEADATARARLAADGRFEDITEFMPSSKVQPALAELISGGAKSVDVSLVALTAEDRQTLVSSLERGGGEMLTGCINEGKTIRARLPADLVATLATRGDVRWMERFKRPQLMNDLAVTNVAMNVREVWDPHGLTGEGQNISTSDSGIDTGILETLHKDLRERVKDIRIADGCVTNDVNGHGTHTAGSIVGDGTMSTNIIRGTAFAANLYAWSCSKGDDGIYTPTNMTALYTADGAWTNYIHSASWGAALNGEYNEECVEHDQYVWENADYLPVFAAGNEGLGGSCTVSSPGAAKNVLTVGATQNLREGHDGDWGNGDPTVTAVFSSRGPCQDGRVKPDIAAPGVGVLSTRSRFSNYTTYGVYEANTNYAYDTGTSMACPLTAGAVALVRQWLVERKGFADEDGKRPTAALMKAVIMGGAKDVAVPNNDQGWGRVDLAETLFPTNGRAVKLIDRIPFAAGFTTNIVIETTNAAPLDVQLVWVDYPGSSSSSPSAPKLVNDIDLSVDSHVIGDVPRRYGNGGSGPDTLNNAEVVRIAEAAPAKYVITIDCKTILHDHTEGGAAALYIRGAFDPAANIEEPTYVRLKKQQKGFIALDRALAAVRDEGETVEILDWVHLVTPVTLTNSCTIVATNEDAAAAYVARSSGAGLTVATNATVTLRNVVFAESTEQVVSVDAGGCLKIGPEVDFGLDVFHVAVRTADTNGLDLAGSLTRRLFFSCANAKTDERTFGTFSCDYPTASASAEMIVCADDADRLLRGSAVSASGRLLWKKAFVPLDEASGYFVDGDGLTNTYARTEKALEEFRSAVEAGRASEFVVLRDGEFASLFGNVGVPLTIRGEGEPRPVLTVADGTGFRLVDDGSLTVSNLVFSGYGAFPADGVFMEVDGGALTLDAGATIDGITGRVDGQSGVIDLLMGSVTMREGSAVVNCSAEGDTRAEGYGGAIYVDSAKTATDCLLNLHGGTITNCSASSFGGAVYVFANPSYKAQLDVRGELYVFDNCSYNGSSVPVVDDVHISKYCEQPYLRLVGEVKGRVGIRYGSSESGNDEGEAFMTYAAGMPAETVRDSAPCFFSDTDEELYGNDGEDGTLVWLRIEDDGTCPEDSAAAHVYQLDAEGKELPAKHYYDLETALAYMTPGTTNRVEMYADGFVYECLGDDAEIPTGCDVTLMAREPSGYAIRRTSDVQLVVPAGTSLTLTNIVFKRMWVLSYEHTITKPFINVDGGALTLAAGAVVNSAVGNTSCDAGSVTVQNHGTFTMLSGSEISHSYNYYNSTNDNDGVTTRFGKGGGVLLAGGTTAYLLGGTITDCAATCGGGVYAMGGATVHLSGDMAISDNKWLAYGGAVGGKSNLWIEDPASLWLDGDLTERVGTGYRTNWSADTNLVAKVSSDWAWDVTSLTNSAAQFFNDATGARALAVTNASEALIVWCGAVRNGVYTNAVNKGYALVGEPYAEEVSSALLPALADGTDAAAVEKELAKLADPVLVEKITTREEYERFRVWAEGVSGGKDAVAESAYAYVSYEFGTVALLTAEPDVEITQVENAGGGLTVSVVVRDGEDPVLVASAKVAEMFQATTDVTDWTSELDLTVTDLTKSTAGEVRFTVVPTGNPATAFIRLRY